MRLMLVADGRSPITRGWLNALRGLEVEIFLVSTYPCSEPPGVHAWTVLPVALASLGGSRAGQTGRTSGGQHPLRRFRPFLQQVRYWLGPLSLPVAQRHFRRLVQQFKPDLIHALRIPYEGMLAASAPAEVPLIVSIWGNDLTLHAQGSPLMRRLTQHVLQRTNGLLADCRRDLSLARLWGFDAQRPTLVAVGNGGLDLERLQEMHLPLDATWRDRLSSDERLWVINPRGIRQYVRNDLFFQIIPLVRERCPGVQFICPGMAGQPEAERWVKRLKLEHDVALLPTLPQGYLWNIFARAPVMVSLTSHDGTPNTLLEAMAWGCFPVLGDLESLREWIIPGVNGLLVDMNRPQAVAEALVLALENTALRQRATEINRRLIRERASLEVVRSQVDRFYQKVSALH